LGRSPRQRTREQCGASATTGGLALAGTLLRIRRAGSRLLRRRDLGGAACGSPRWGPRHTNVIGRPKKPPGEAHPLISARVLPATLTAIKAEADRTGLSAGQVLDRLAAVVIRTETPIVQPIRPCPICRSITGVDYTKGQMYRVRCPNDECIAMGPEGSTRLEAIVAPIGTPPIGSGRRFGFRVARG
jgi:hypothetical protein